MLGWRHNLALSLAAQRPTGYVLTWQGEVNLKHMRGPACPPDFPGTHHNPQSLPRLPGLLSMSSHSLQACQGSPNSSQRGPFPNPWQDRSLGPVFLHGKSRNRVVTPSLELQRTGHVTLLSQGGCYFSPAATRASTRRPPGLLPRLPSCLWGGRGTQSHLLRLRRCPSLSPTKEPMGSISRREIHGYLMTVPLSN